MSADLLEKNCNYVPELDFVEWRKHNSGKILLVTFSDKSCKFYGIDRDSWVKQTIKN